MLTVRLANCVPLKACVSAFGRSNTKGVAPLKQSCLSQRLQLFASESRQSIRRQAVVQEKTLKENLTTRAGDTSKKSLGKQRECYSNHSSSYRYYTDQNLPLPSHSIHKHL